MFTERKTAVKNKMYFFIIFPYNLSCQSVIKAPTTAPQVIPLLINADDAHRDGCIWHLDYPLMFLREMLQRLHLDYL